MGGKDQLGNIVAGQEMISKEVDNEVCSVTLNCYLLFYTILYTH